MPQRGKGITMNLLNNEPQHPTTNDQTPTIEDDNNLIANAGNESESQIEPVIEDDVASDNTGDANGTVNASDGRMLTRMLVMTQVMIAKLLRLTRN